MTQKLNVSFARESEVGQLLMGQMDINGLKILIQMNQVTQRFSDSQCVFIQVVRYHT